MSNPILLQNSFNRMVRDHSRDSLPVDGVWNLEDFIPHLGAPLRRRGGYSYFGVTLNSLNASAGQPDRVAFAPFTTGLQVIAIDSSIPRLFDLTNAADRGSVNKPVGPMVFYRDKLIIPCNAAGANPQKYTGSGAPAALAGTPPDFPFAAVYKDRLAVIQQGASTANTIKRVVSADSSVTFTLTFQGQTTSTQSHSDSAAELQADLEALSNIAPGDVTVTLNAVGDWNIEFKGAYAAMNVELTATLVGGTGVTVSTVQAGVGFSTSPRIFFSGAGDPESWDTTNRYIDTSGNLVALAALPNALLCFHAGTVERIRGSIPPGSAAANMELDPLFSDVGLVGNDAVDVAEGYCYWADESGVYRTDGTALTDLTKQGEMSSYWREQAGLAAGSIALKVWRGYLWISLLDASDNYVDFLVCDIDKRAWFRFRNIKAYNFATQYGATDELYFSNRDTSSKKIGTLSNVFDPDGNISDADGDAVAPKLETGIYKLKSEGEKRWRHIYLNYYLTDTGSPDPNFTISYVTDPADAGHTSFGSFSMTGATRERRRLKLGRPASGVGLKIQQSNASGDTRIYAIEGDVGVREPSRRS